MLVKYASCDTLGSLCDTKKKKKKPVLQASQSSDAFYGKVSLELIVPILSFL